MGFFDPILDNSVIAQKLTNFIHYELSHLNRVIICIKKARVTGEFIKSIKECLDLFQVDALASLVKICITDLKVSIREEWMKEFFDNLQIKAVIEEYKLSKENFLGVDLFLSGTLF